MIDQPRALVVEDSPTHALLAEVALAEQGFVVATESSLLTGLRHAESWLHVGSPRAPTLILIDLMLPHERCPMLEGTALAAYLDEAMERGTLHPAYLVAISAEPTPQRAYEVQLAGCQSLLPKPITPEHAALLLALVAIRPKATPHGDTHTRFARQALRRDAERLIQLLRSAQAYQFEQVPHAIHWTTADVRHLLFEPTALLRAEPWRSWMMRQGGIDAVRTRLRDTWLREELQKVLDVVLRHGNNAHTNAAVLNLSRATYYRRIDDLLAALMPILNVWP